MRAVLVVIVLVVIVFFAWPPPIDSRPFVPKPAPPLEGPLKTNDSLEACDKVSIGDVFHADKLLAETGGRIYAGDDRGTIHRLSPDARGRYSSEVYATIPGRPMQLSFAPDGSLIAANLRGPLFEIGRSGEVRELDTPNVAGGTFGVAVARDGKIYYSAHPEALSGDDTTAALLAALEMHPSGELRSLDRSTGQTRTLVSGLYTPVGVALSANEDFVAVNEFYAYRVTRYWLKGPKAGTSDRLIENLPGVVDGIASDGRGTFFVSIPGLRYAMIDWMQPRPRVKNQFSKLMLALLAFGVTPGAAHTMVVEVDERGAIKGSLHDPEGRVVNQVTDAVPIGDRLFVTSIAGDWIARCPLGAAAERQ